MDECIEGLLFGLEHSCEQVNILNLGTNSSTNVASIADMVVEAMGIADVKFKYTGGSRGWRGDVTQVRYDNTRMKDIGWEPELSSDEAVRKAIKGALEG